MNPKNDRWTRLFGMARRTLDGEPAKAPAGFSTRVAARWTDRQRPEVVWEFISVRALGIACLVMGLTIAVNLMTVHRPSIDYDLVLVDPLAQNIVQP